MKYFIAPDYKRAFSFDKRFSKKVVLEHEGKGRVRSGIKSRTTHRLGITRIERGVY